MVSCLSHALLSQNIDFDYVHIFVCYWCQVPRLHNKIQILKQKVVQRVQTQKQPKTDEKRTHVLLWWPKKQTKYNIHKCSSMVLQLSVFFNFFEKIINNFSNASQADYSFSSH